LAQVWKLHFLSCHCTHVLALFRMGYAAYAVVLSKAAVGLWIWSVWSWRLRMETSFRAEGAKNLVQEFQKYGYPMWVLKLTGFFKFLFSGLLLISIMFPDPRLTAVGAGGMIFLMVVAVGSHIKVKDDLTNNIAALIMLVLSLFILAMMWIKPATAGQGYRYAFGYCHPDIATQGFGLLCSIACAGMVFRSFTRGDYNLDNYEKLDEPYLLMA